MISLVMGVLAACVAAVQFSLGVAAAANDDGNLPGGRLIASKTTTVAHYDIYHSKQKDLTSLCSGSDSAFAWVSIMASVPVYRLKRCAWLYIAYSLNQQGCSSWRTWQLLSVFSEHLPISTRKRISNPYITKLYFYSRPEFWEIDDIRELKLAENRWNIHTLAIYRWSPDSRTCVNYISSSGVLLRFIKSILQSHASHV